MKNTRILPFLYDNDEYDDNTIRYWEQHNEEGYFYELYILIRSKDDKDIDNKRANIIITPEGVSLDINTKPLTIKHTNIVPNKLFPNKKKLEWDDMLIIIEVLENTNLEGVSYDAARLFQKWKDLGKPDGK